MKRIRREAALAASALRGRNGRIAVMVITIILFVISAGAPNATIGIGK